MIYRSSLPSRLTRDSVCPRERERERIYIVRMHYAIRRARWFSSFILPNSSISKMRDRPSKSGESVNHFSSNNSPEECKK